MKKFAAFILFSIYFSIGISFANEGKDLQQYEILDESDYAVFFYDTQKSLIEQFYQGNEADANFRTFLLLGELDLLKIKNEVINNMKKENFHISNGFDTEILERITEHFQFGVDNFLKNIKSADLLDAEIYMYILSPDFYELSDENYDKAMRYNAAGIAVSRFDHRYWHDKIEECYLAEDKNQTKNTPEIIKRCAEEYKKQVDEEVIKVMDELTPYKAYFENMYQQKEDDIIIRKSSKSGKTYLDTIKR